MKVGLPTPEKLRQAIVRAFHEEGLSYQQIARLLNIGEATVSRVLRLHRETGRVTPQPRGGGNFSPIRGKVATQFKRLVAKMPDATVAELHQALTQCTGVITSRAAVLRALHRLGFSYKKSPSSPPRGTARPTSGAGESSPRS